MCHLWSSPFQCLNPFSILLFCRLVAIARSMEEWERKKEEGELGSEQEQEEENIYAVSKEPEV